MLIVHILPTASFGGWSRDRYKAKFGVEVSFDSHWVSFVRQQLSSESNDNSLQIPNVPHQAISSEGR